MCDSCPHPYCLCLPNTAEQCTPCYQRCNRSQFLHLTQIKRHHSSTPSTVSLTCCSITLTPAGNSRINAATSSCNTIFHRANYITRTCAVQDQISACEHEASSTRVQPGFANLGLGAHVKGGSSLLTVLSLSPGHSLVFSVPCHPHPPS